MPWCTICQRPFEAKRPYGPNPRCCSGRCRAKASRERRLKKLGDRLRAAKAAIEDAEELIAVRSRRPRAEDTEKGGPHGAERKKT